MAGIQSLIDSAVMIDIDKSKPTAISMSRGQRLKTQSRGPMIYRFSVTMSPGLRYDLNQNRGVLEDFDAAGRTEEQTITLSNSAGASWIMEYQGDLSNSDISTLTIDATTGNANLVVNVSNTSAGASDYVVRKGDYVQPDGSRYTYQSTADVTRGSGSTVTIPLNREIFGEDGYNITAQSVQVGTNCTFRVKMLEQPTYSIVPGRYISFNGPMLLSEVITA